jgi:hypothetical protein
MTTYPISELPERSLIAEIELEEAVLHIARVIPKSVVDERMKEGAKDPVNFIPAELFHWDKADRHSSDRSNTESKEIYYNIISAFFSREGKASKSQRIWHGADKYEDFSKFLIGADPQSPLDEETARTLLGELYLVDWLCTGELQVWAERGREGRQVVVAPLIMKIASHDEINFISTGEIPSSGDGHSYRFMIVKYGELKKLFSRVKRTGLQEEIKEGRPGVDIELMRSSLAKASDDIQSRPLRKRKISKIMVADKALEIYVSNGGQNVKYAKTIVSNKDFRTDLTQIVTELRALQRSLS